MSSIEFAARPRRVIAGMLRRQAKVQPSRWCGKSAPTRIWRWAESPVGAVFSKRPETQWRRVQGLPGSQQGAARGDSMRLIVGIIIGCALTVGGAYIADTISAAGARPVMVNWDVVAKNLDSVTTLARAGWKKIAG